MPEKWSGMNHKPQSRARRRLLVALPAIALAATSLTVSGSAAAQSPSGTPRAVIGADEHYINYAEPEVQPDTTGREVKGKGGIYTPAAESAREFDQKHARGNPVTARQLAKDEAKSLKTGQNPRKFKKAPTTQTAKLLTLLVEFNDKANDDFTDVDGPQDGVRGPHLRPRHRPERPAAQQDPEPGDACPTRTTTRCGCRTSRRSTTTRCSTRKKGITERVRTDLKGPDGKKGIDLSGHTMQQHVPGDVQGRVHGGRAGQPVDHGAALRGAGTRATRCFQDETGAWVPGREQAMNGHPDNPRGRGPLAIDAIDALAAADPNFPWADYDIEDQGDATVTATSTSRTA